MRVRPLSRRTFAALAAILAGACSSPTVTPPAVVNTPPTIESLVIAGTRAEADSPIQVSAAIKDTETPLGQLTYTWSASPQSGTSPQPGTFSGNAVSGSQALITWRAPKGQTTPNVYTVTLTVSEAYTSAGQAKQNVVSRSATVRYNDSPAEVAFLARDFLVDKFGRFEVGPAEAVSNFSDSCRGKADEFEDVEDNRASVHILSASFAATRIAFDSSMTTGTVEGPCQFEDIPNGGVRQFVSGTCLLTTVYESDSFRWRLCTSNFNGPFNTTPASLRGRVPGRPYIR